MEIINRRSEIIILIIQLVICKYKSINREISFENMLHSTSH